MNMKVGRLLEKVERAPVLREAEALLRANKELWKDIRILASATGYKVSYCAGPLGAPTLNGVLDNIQAAETQSLKLWLIGFPCICPHANSQRGTELSVDDDLFLEGDLNILRVCDVVYFMKNWEKSRGARIEYMAALKAGIPCYWDFEAMLRTPKRPRG